MGSGDLKAKKLHPGIRTVLLFAGAFLTVITAPIFISAAHTPTPLVLPEVTFASPFFLGAFS
jgi:hypothetical protein